jgi:hypothetical protein
MFDSSLRKQKQKDPSNVVISKHLFLRGNETKRNDGYEPKRLSRAYLPRLSKKSFFVVSSGV